MKDAIELFKKLHENTGDIVKALENEDEKEFESAFGRFLVIMMQLDTLK